MRPVRSRECTRAYTARGTPESNGKEPIPEGWLVLLEEILVGEREVPAVADDDVVEELDAEEVASLLEPETQEAGGPTHFGRSDRAISIRPTPMPRLIALLPKVWTATKPVRQPAPDAGPALCSRCAVPGGNPEVQGVSLGVAILDLTRSCVRRCHGVPGRFRSGADSHAGGPWFESRCDHSEVAKIAGVFSLPQRRRGREDDTLVTPG